MQMPPPPARSFASDNAAGAHPAVLEAIAAANTGHALAYGEDRWTRECAATFDELLGRPVTTLLTFNGTGANVVSLANLLGPAEAVVCTDAAHIAVDETGASERILGVKLIDVPTDDGKLRPEHLDEVVAKTRGIHHAQPGVVSITQSTELGTVYSVDEIVTLADAAHRHGLRVHLDGARIANAVAALGGGAATLRAMTVDAGVDVFTFGGTKNGLLGAEAVILTRPEAAPRAEHLRKQTTQLASKMRFLAAQLLALLAEDRWLTLAEHANRAAQRLFDGVRPLPGLDPGPPPAVNSIFPVLPRPAIRQLQDWSFFWDWDVTAGQVRWMTAWDTTDEDIERFVAGVTRVTPN